MSTNPNHPNRPMCVPAQRLAGGYIKNGLHEANIWRTPDELCSRVVSRTAQSERLRANSFSQHILSFKLSLCTYVSLRACGSSRKKAEGFALPGHEPKYAGEEPRAITPDFWRHAALASFVFVDLLGRVAQMPSQSCSCAESCEGRASERGHIRRGRSFPLIYKVLPQILPTHKRAQKSFPLSQVLIFFGHKLKQRTE